MVISKENQKHFPYLGGEAITFITLRNTNYFECYVGKIRTRFIHFSEVEIKKP